MTRRSDLGKRPFAVYGHGLWGEQLRLGRLEDAVARWIAPENEGG